MKRISISLLAFAYLSTASLQESFNNSDLTDYFMWFNQNSTTPNLYQKHATLYIFNDFTNLHLEADTASDIILELCKGDQVINLDDENTRRKEDQIDGYDDVWFHVQIIKADQSTQQGYIWGANIAKAWAHANLTDAPLEELILVGVSSKKRAHLQEMKASLKLLNNNGLLDEIELDDFCVFDACESSQLIRFHNNYENEQLQIIEVSSLTVSCEVGLDKSYLLWNNQDQRIKEVYRYSSYAEKVLTASSFLLQNTSAGQATTTKYTFLKESDDYVPEWVVVK